MNFHLNQQDVFSKTSMAIKIEVKRNCPYLASGECFGLGASIVEVGSQLAQPATAFASAGGGGGRSREPDPHPLG